jgi:ribosomal protein S19E (S16A)
VKLFVRSVQNINSIVNVIVMNLKGIIKTIDINIFNQTLVKYLKEFKFTIPEWFNYTKTGVCKERVPDSKDWYYFRMASILRHLVHKPKGIKKLRYKYSGLKNRGSRPDRVYPSSGNINRKIVQILSKFDLLANHIKGRYTSTKGKELIKKF